MLDFGNGDTLRLLGVTKASLSWDDFSFGAAVQGDFGGNGHEDILWRRDDGSASIWDDGRIGGGHIISGAGVMGSEAVGTLPAPATSTATAATTFSGATTTPRYRSGTTARAAARTSFPAPG
jgi:hypothetical protein